MVFGVGIKSPSSKTLLLLVALVDLVLFSVFFGLYLTIALVVFGVGINSSLVGDGGIKNGFSYSSTVKVGSK